IHKRCPLAHTDGAVKLPSRTVEHKVQRAGKTLPEPVIVVNTGPAQGYIVVIRSKTLCKPQFTGHIGPGKNKKTQGTRPSPLYIPAMEEFVSNGADQPTRIISQITLAGTDGGIAVLHTVAKYPGVIAYQESVATVIVVGQAAKDRLFCFHYFFHPLRVLVQFLV